MLQNARMTWNPLRNSRPTPCKISRSFQKISRTRPFPADFDFSHGEYKMFICNILKDEWEFAPTSWHQLCCKKLRRFADAKVSYE
jgi:hypothetical protein